MRGRDAILALRSSVVERYVIGAPYPVWFLLSLARTSPHLVTSWAKGLPLLWYRMGDESASHDEETL